MATSITEQPLQESYIIPLERVGKACVYKGNKVNFKIAEEAIKRINAFVEWSHDNDEIVSILQNHPKYCFFAVQDNNILGYAIVRGQHDGRSDFHLSYIATDALGKGIGTLLMKKIIERNKKLGHKFLNLTHRKNDNLTAFYKKVADQMHLDYQLEDIEPIRFQVTYTM